jgi:hypothetical protein
LGYLFGYFFVIFLLILLRFLRLKFLYLQRYLRKPGPIPESFGATCIPNFISTGALHMGTF